MASLLLLILYIAKGYLRAVALYKIIYRRRRDVANGKEMIREKIKSIVGNRIYNLD